MEGSPDGMKLLNWLKWSRKKELVEPEMDKQWLLKEIRKAHQDWLNAQYRYDYALDKEQVDYAIVMLEAAEKRYDMLLREAKKYQVHHSELYYPGLDSRDNRASASEESS